MGWITHAVEGLREGRTVQVRIRGNWLLHLVTAAEKTRVQIGNNRGKINGWAGRSSILGKVANVVRS